MSKFINTDALAGANFRTGIGLMKFIDSLPEAVTRCIKCGYFEPAKGSLQCPRGKDGICKVYNMFKNSTADFCSEGKPKT